MEATRLERMVAGLEETYGRQALPPPGTALEMILWENVAYLADDARRREAFQKLKREVGLTPDAILAAPNEKLLEIAGAGILPATFAEKLRKVARIAKEEFGGKLDSVLRLPVSKARKALQRFPGIGEPGAEKILLFLRVYPLPALESNGLRVLLRLGFGQEQKSYSASYRSAQKAIEHQHEGNCGWLIRAHLVLRRHGQELCRRNHPMCERCPLVLECRYYQAGLAGAALRG
ncbi:MAG TPA: endonuclease III domain-containing protein [Terriglobia bacterium]|nr:endonuclease III domain-containing protein [Terriglobia bacterium]